ncbi:MAG: hypothetical protein AAGB22_01970 [Bacteroidota bacterium]
MKSVKLADNELAQMRVFYEQELEKTLHRLEHITTRLERLGGDAPQIAINIANVGAVAAGSNGSATAAAPASKSRKRPGPKSVWGNFIIKRLRQVNRPITYDQMVLDAIAFMKIPDDKHKNARQSIINSAFRLRNVHKKIETVSKKGKRGKYLCLRQWFDTDGQLKKEYVSML